MRNIAPAPGPASPAASEIGAALDALEVVYVYGQQDDRRDELCAWVPLDGVRDLLARFFAAGRVLDEEQLARALCQHAGMDEEEVPKWRWTAASIFAAARGDQSVSPDAEHAEPAMSEGSA
jgi:hypothetical protein